LSDTKLHRIHPDLRIRAREMRQPLTAAEQQLWSKIRNRNLGRFKFRRQVPLGYYIVDFYCAEAHLIIELDGDSHTNQEDYDLDRSAWLIGQGRDVIRFNNFEIYQNLDDVLGRILSICQKNIETTQ
jgi:very-short-patch-repair endonuclease